MRRQLRASGGITNARQGYGIGSWVKERIRKIIPNELADVAVKAAPFVAPFQPGIAAAMRGIGRFDQRGSMSDAFKQAAGTYAFGKAAGKLGGASGSELLNPGRQTYSMEGFKTKGLGKFLGTEGTGTNNAFSKGNDGAKKFAEDQGKGFMEKTTDKIFDKIPFGDKLNQTVKEKLFVGGVTSAATYLYEKFVADYPEPEPGEDMAAYMAERRQRVGTQMRTYMDNYLAYDPQYSAMSDAEKDAFVERNNKNMGGLMRTGYANGSGGITMANTLAQNVAQNRANQTARANELEMARSRLPGYQAPQRAMAPTKAPMLTPRDLNPPGLFPRPPLMPITQPIEPGQPAPKEFKVEEMLGDKFLVPNDSQYVPPTEEESLIGGPVPPVDPGYYKPEKQGGIGADLSTPLPNNNGFNFRAPTGDYGRYVVDNDPGMQFEGYSSYQNYIDAGNDPVERRMMGQSPLESAGGLGEIDMPIAGGINNEMGILPVEPQLPGFRDVPQGGMNFSMPSYNDPLPQDQLLSGFEQFKKNNPEVMRGAGTMAIVPVTLPGGYSYDFSGSQEANAFNKYLASIGQAPYQGRRQPGDLAKLGGGLSKLEVGGRVGLAEGSDNMILPMKKPETEKFLTREEAEKLYPGMFVDTTTFNPVPDNAAELAIDELAKVILGTRGSDKNFMKNEYIIPTVKKISENYGYSEAEIVKMLKDQMMTYSKPKKEKMNKGGIMRLNYMIGGEAKQMEAGAPPIMYSGNMDPNAQNQQAGLPSVPGPMQMAEDGPEFDMRENGGFQPLGRQEGKDDVPAMLAKNEFVMTADAVRAAGGGSIQKGAQKMYNTMKKLESRVS